MSRISMDVIRTTAAYSMGEAAHYLNLPPTTLRAWCLGQRGFRAVIRLDGKSPWALSFLNLVEAHVLAAIRREHKVPLPAVRKALKYVQDHLDLNRPLVQAAFETDGVSLFVERLGHLINASQEGKTAMREILQAHLRRIERDGKGLPIKLFLFTRRDGTAQAPSPIVVDPRISFGRPVLVGRSVPTAVLADRFKAGDSLRELAEDYEAPPEAIEVAVRFEVDRLAA